MNRAISICTLVVAALSLSCGIPKAEFDALKAENEALQAELDECQFGAEKLVAKIEKAYAEKDFSAAKKNIALLREKHPESPKNEEFVALLKIIRITEAEEKKQREIAEKEKKRLANLNNTGMWRVGYYVDEFDEPTKNAYVVNRELIKGVFSNTATTDSLLHVKFLIDGSWKIAIQLFEYGRNNPVKAYSKEVYFLLFQDRDGNRIDAAGVNEGDRIRFSKQESKKIHNALIKGGKIKFRCVQSDTPTNVYEFDIENADYYQNAYRILKESE